MSSPAGPAITTSALQRVAWTLGSAFVLWHSAALLLGTAPPSYLHGQLMPLFRGYIEALHLDGRWAFFAPDPTAGRLLRYRVEQRSGASSEFVFTESLRRADPAYLRFTTMSSAADAAYPEVMHSVAQMLCRRHAALTPQRIHFVGLQQIRITPEEVEAGEHALDPSHLRRVDIGSVPCESGQ